MAIENTDNFLLKSNFILTCPHIPVLSNLAQTVDLPSLTVGEVEGPNRFHNVMMPGEKLVFDSIDIAFIVDEYMDSYMEIFNWMQQMVGTEVDEEDRVEHFADIKISVLTNKENGTGRIITFEDCFPISLSPLSFEANTDSMAPNICVVTFATSNMNIKNSELDVTKFTKYTYNYEK